MPPEERVLKTLREKLNIYRVEHSRVIVVEFSSEDPALAEAIPNAIADAYLAVQQRAKSQSNADATDWLEPEIADLSRRVKDAEQKVATFRSQSDLFVGQNNSVLADQQLSELSTELSRVRANRTPPRPTPKRCARAGQRRRRRRAAGGAVGRDDPAAARDRGAAQGAACRPLQHLAARTIRACVP